MDMGVVVKQASRKPADPVRMYFTEEQAVELAGITKRQLRYWYDTNVFLPEVQAAREDMLLTFRDLVGLRALATLRKRTSLQELRKLGEWLRARYEAPWSSLRFYLVGEAIQFNDPRTGRRLDSKPVGQAVVPFELERVADDTETAVRQFIRRSDDDFGKISKTRGVARSAEVVAGTRIPTSAIWSLFQRGGVDGTIREYPTLTRADVEAAVEHERQRRRSRTG